MLQTEDIRRQRFGKRIVRGIRQSKRNAAALIIVQTIFVQPYTDERADMNVSPFHMQKSGRGGKTNGNDSDEKSKEVERNRV